MPLPWFCLPLPLFSIYFPFKREVWVWPSPSISPAIALHSSPVTPFCASPFALLHTFVVIARPHASPPIVSCRPPPTRFPSLSSEARVRVLGVGRAKEMRGIEGSRFSGFGEMGVDPCTTTVLPATIPCRRRRLICRHLFSLSLSLSRNPGKGKGFGKMEDREGVERMER